MEQEYVSFADLYRIDERKYAGLPIQALFLSYGTTKRLLEQDVISVADLLRKTPEALMKIEGFGITCLNEIRQRIETLEQKYPQDVVAPIRMITLPTVLPQVKEDSQTQRTVGEQVDMLPEEYEGIDILSMSFSTRMSNLLQRYGIKTVADLLRFSLEDLLKTRGFGKNCWEEVKTQLQETKQRCNAVNERALTGNAEQEARAIVDPELIVACEHNPEIAVELISMLKQFYQHTETRNELMQLFQEIPQHRWTKKASGYIRAFTKDESQRNMLNELYGDENAVLKDILDREIQGAQMLWVAKRFLSWCKFDLGQEIEQLFTAIYPNEKYRTIAQGRANKVTLEQLGLKYKLTRERIRQIEKKIKKTFTWRQSRIKIISKINADKNDSTVVVAADLAKYCKADQLQELIYFLQSCNSSNYIYDQELDVFVVGDDTLHERAVSFVEDLPDLIGVKELPKYCEAAEDYDLTKELAETAIKEAYRLTGGVYHRASLTLAAIYAEVVKEFYPEGIHAYDPKELNDFRQIIFEKYGDVNLPEKDHALTSRIAAICVLCGRGKYKLKQKTYISKDLAKRIDQYIEDSEFPIFMTNTLFAVFEKELRKAGVDNKYYLQGILRELFGEKYTFKRDYVSKDPTVTSIYSSVVNYVKESLHPVSKKQLMQAFPGIPEIVLSISLSDPEILNYFGEYLHASKLEISRSEVLYIQKIIESLLKDNRAHRGSEVFEAVCKERPEIFTRNGAMFQSSAYSILEYLFQEQYQFERPYIANPGVEIERPMEVLHEYVYSKEEVRIEDIRKYAKEHRGIIYSLLEYFDSCNDKFLLADGETLLAIGKTGIDVNVAREVEEIVLREISKTTPIRDLSCWELLPRIKIAWTPWLVYSVLKKWGKSAEVAPSNSQYLMSVPLVAPEGKMDAAPYAELYKLGSKPKHVTTAIHDLDHIDDILADILDEDLLGEDLWDSEI